jgi:hypothetical protein
MIMPVFVTNVILFNWFFKIIFQIGSHIYAQADLDHYPPIYALYLARMTGMCHHTQLFIGWDEAYWTFCLCWPRTACWVARIIGMIHCTQTMSFYLNKHFYKTNFVIMFYSFRIIIAHCLNISWMLRILNMSAQLIFLRILHNRWKCHHFTDENTKAKRCKVYYTQLDS